MDKMGKIGKMTIKMGKIGTMAIKMGEVSTAGIPIGGRLVTLPAPSALHLYRVRLGQRELCPPGVVGPCPTGVLVP
jgi:hypothetical protein